ncbi:AI-2E family transporter [Candidatus Microgenomates bacterium]|nr:AI-2E family transporter [Candidatus Microgenomates bacterium]
MPRKIEVSHKTIIFTAIFIGILWFVYLIGDIILMLFVSLLLTAIINPLVVKLSKFKIPKGVSITLVYLLVISLLSGAIALIVPPLIEQTTNLVNTLPKNMESLGLQYIANGEVLRQLVSQLRSLPSQIVKAGFGIFANVLNVFTVLIFAFYMLLTRDKLDENLKVLFGKEKSSNFTKLITIWETKLGGWARGQLFLMLLIGVSTYIGLLILGVRYALPLAVLAGLLEIIPYLGPVVAAVPAVIIAFAQSPFLGFATIALAFLIQQLENYVFVPKVMQKSVGISPVITLFALSVGFRLAGVVGIIISMPVVITIQLLLQQRFSK